MGNHIMASGSAVDEPGKRLSDISTRWSVIFRAHQDNGAQKQAAQLALVERYCGAIYYYLLGAIREPNVVEDLCQEFAYRVVRGDFKRADPRQGRFRDYIKTSLHHLVADYRREQQGQPRSLPFDSALFVKAESDVGNPEEEFVERWREELLDRAWEGLAGLERETGPHYHAVLRLRAEQPEVSSERMAEELSRRLGKPLSAVAVRQALHRAREKFANLLLEEVARSLETADRAQVEQELIDLKLLSYCKPALEKRKGTT